jgi:lactate dehydrogenase-like 2-hydroxyacid dehydrogenase
VSFVVVTAELPGRWREILAEHEVVVVESAGLAPLLPRADALLPLLKVRVDNALLDAAPLLKIVANYAVGVDNIDLPACAQRGVVVTNTPDVLTRATAEVAILLMLAAARRAREGLEMCVTHSWRGWTPQQMIGIELGGTRLGIVGPGRIGRAVAARAAAFEMDIVTVGRGQSLDALADCDFIQLCCPLTDETRRMINAASLARFKRGAILVNTARGGLIDEDALADALDSGQLAAVGLDVFSAEPSIPPRLAAHPRAFLLPHIGSGTAHTRAAMAETAAANIADFFAGRPPRNRVV